MIPVALSAAPLSGTAVRMSLPAKSGLRGMNVVIFAVSSSVLFAPAYSPLLNCVTSL